uniref:Kinesin-like protein n=1 Tax=Astyanax mexicanus TaxID=7994 RepID=A0A8B9LQK1_ASTMX
MSAHSSEVKVFVRTRPTACFAQDLIEYLPDKQTVNVRHRRESRKGVVNNQMSSWSFKLDGVMHNMSQEEVYQSVAHSVVLRALEGYNGTIMCFGQTGAGKTYTMTGATESYQQRGIIPRALQEVFYEVEQRVDHTFSVFLSFLEIYNETLVDLLASIKRGRAVQGGALTIVEDPGGGVSVKGLTLHPVHNEEEAFNLLFEGEMNRIIGEHALNKNSSRSHCIFTIHIESRSRTLSDEPYVTSKLNLVDLAGSERLSKTGSEGQVQREALYINRSLSFLEQAIIALTDLRREHVPFRQSKLTHSLKDSLGGNCNTVLVANIYGEAAQIEETVRRLFLSIIFTVQIFFLFSTQANRAVVPNESLSDRQVDEIKSQVQRYLAGTLDEITVINMLAFLKKITSPLSFSSPPCKFEAFEDFKLGRGSEINRILKENKGVLLERMDQLHKLTQAINSCKRDIDHMSSELQLCREQRQSQGQFVGEKGEPVLEEAELILLVGLREKKDQYRQSYEELLSTKAEVRYCQHLVDQCRIRLLTEFESWYNESFLLPEEVQTIFSEGGPIRPGLIPVDKEADEQEQFQRLRTELLAEGPSAVSFYNAHNRTVQRVRNTQ